jgi:hypothetical protein
VTSSTSFSAYAQATGPN